MSGTTFPPVGPTSLRNILAAYPYQQYADDDNIRAFFDSFNGLAQTYQDWFNGILLPIYTSPTIAGPLLDWVAQGLYGISRPTLPVGSSSSIGPWDTWQANSIELNSVVITGSVTTYIVSDDHFRRIITWHFFKGDGQHFCTMWLKRRIMRFLIGLNGTAPNIDQTYPISIQYPGSSTIAVKIDLSVDPRITQANAAIFQAAAQSGVLALPFQNVVTVDLV